MQRWIGVPIALALTSSLAYGECRVYANHALPAAAQSVEARHPGLVKNLIELQESVRHEPMHFYEIRDRLERLTQGRSDPRIEEYLQPLEQQLEINPKALTSFEGRKHIAGKMTEIATAMMFHGAKVYLGQKVSQFLGADYQKAIQGLSHDEIQKIDREIDLALQMADGSWIWVETKNWTAKEMDAPDRFFQRKVIKQSIGQDFARKHFPKLKIELILVNRIKPPEAVISELQRETRFDKIYYLVP